MSLSRILPAPRQQVARYAAPRRTEAARGATGASKAKAPAYGQRKGWVPRNDEDFGDGGAYPECSVKQYPLGMGRKDGRASRALALTVNATGGVQYDAVIKQNLRKGQKMYSSYTDLVEKDVTVGDASLMRPSLEALEENTDRTRRALEKMHAGKIKAQAPRSQAHDGRQVSKPSYIRYTPANQNSVHNSGAAARIIRLHEMPTDPLEPPKYKHRKAPNGPGSPPAPVMHSPARRVTVQDQQNWKIPPCVSNWKNIKGYTIPLHQRLAADGRGLQEKTMNDNFASLAQALHVAKRTAQVEIQERAKMRRQIRKQQKLKKERELDELAMKALQAGNDDDDEEEEDAGEGDADAGTEETGPKKKALTEEEIKRRDEREELRRERRRDRRRDLRLEERDKKDKRRKGTRHRDRAADRDISEKIALGQGVTKSKDSLYDSRLFNRSEGLDSGHGADDSYHVYSKPLFKDTDRSLYRPKKVDTEVYGGDDQESLLESKGTKKFKADRAFAGTRGERQARTKPVQFEKDRTEGGESPEEGEAPADEADPFGMMDIAFGTGKSKKGKERRPNALEKIGTKGQLLAGSSGGLGGSESSSVRDKIGFREGSKKEKSDSESPEPRKKKRPRSEDSDEEDRGSSRRTRHKGSSSGESRRDEGRDRKREGRDRDRDDRGDRDRDRDRDRRSRRDDRSSRSDRRDRDRDRDRKKSEDRDSKRKRDKSRSEERRSRPSRSQREDRGRERSRRTRDRSGSKSPEKSRSKRPSKPASKSRRDRSSSKDRTSRSSRRRSSPPKSKRSRREPSPKRRSKRGRSPSPKKRSRRAKSESSSDGSSSEDSGSDGSDSSSDDSDSSSASPSPEPKSKRSRRRRSRS